MTPQDESPASRPGDAVPQAVIARRSRWSFSLVWIIPLVAALVGGWTAVKLLRERGTTVTISFRTAEGIEAGKTRLKYRNVDIGEVKRIGFSPDRSHVVVTAEIARPMQSYMVADTNFWVVRPRVAVSGISGLGTLLSGSYIAVEVGKSDESRADFEGLETPPVISGDKPGRQFSLRGDDLGSLDIGSPIYYRRIQVGQVTGYALAEQGLGVDVRIFIDAPYDSYVNTQTRFWKASGVDLRIDASGLKLDLESLQTLIVGGIAFQSPEDAPPGDAASSEFTFVLAEDRVEAMRQPDLVVERVQLDFRESLRGLAPGAPVDFRGIVIGQVRSIGLEYVREDRQVRFPVVVELYPERLRPRGGNAAAALEAPPAREVLRRLISRGLRAQLRAGNLLTGQLYVAFDFFPQARPVTVDLTRSMIEVPTIPGTLEDLQSTVATIARKLERLPLEEVTGDLRETMKSLRGTLGGADRVLQRVDRDVAPELQRTLEEARRAMTQAQRAVDSLEKVGGAAERTLGSAQRTLDNASRTLDPQASLQQDVRSTMKELSRAAQALRSLSDYLERHPDALLRGRREERP